MSFSGGEVKQLQKALLSAYDKSSLTQMVRTDLDEKLDSIAIGGNFGDIVFKLIEWAESKGRIGELIRAAYQENDSNQALKEVADYYGLLKQRTRIQITLEDDEFTDEKRHALFALLADYTGASMFSFEIKDVHMGSVVVTLELPTEYVAPLIVAADTGEFDDQGIISIRHIRIGATLPMYEFGIPPEPSRRRVFRIKKYPSRPELLSRLQSIIEKHQSIIEKHQSIIEKHQSIIEELLKLKDSHSGLKNEELLSRLADKLELSRLVDGELSGLLELELSRLADEEELSRLADGEEISAEELGRISSFTAVEPLELRRISDSEREVRRGRYSSLTAREKEVLTLLSEGRSRAEISGIVGVSPATIRRVSQNIYVKLGVRNRRQAVAIAEDHLNS